MKAKVNVESQVEVFVKSLAPEPRRRLAQAIKALAKDQGDTKRLEGKIEGYNRLRVAGHRVIFTARWSTICSFVYSAKARETSGNAPHLRR